MSDARLFDALFGAGNHEVVIDGHFVAGPARLGGTPVAVIGSWDAAAVDGDLALAIAGEILRVVEADTGTTARPIVFIADTQGQALSRREELLGLNGCFAHVARCVDLARRAGHTTLTLIHGEAVSGGFLAFGMLADRIIALPDAQVRVMDLRAMSRVTKIELERLQTLAKASPVFAPGADNYWRMGAVSTLWDRADGHWPAMLAAELAEARKVAGQDVRARTGAERGGRKLAAAVAAEVAGG
ncbi:biotin-independent malonate decarboxylase subunit gamma [Nitrogeniibacter mangrovi]|uniref:Biotin-independent malonate decarboxylase subunit gamma n=1 Tax=Nitrogeniibacter mangrovi TaxID=2016596 RepID=A0A6C1BBB4_9RHOO|nr:biotin-independent malonate decarboxylase subunit gamma [Nitrogeniibacter mangrovi]QID19564.1 biotin-independent malonate decarboxylase subunit gamma [Nitrogeniibacter mangrovi]